MPADPRPPLDPTPSAPIPTADVVRDKTFAALASLAALKKAAPMPAPVNTAPIPADASELNPRLTKAEEQRVRQQFAADQRALGEGMQRQLGVTADDAVRQARPENVPPAGAVGSDPLLSVDPSVASEVRRLESIRSGSL